MENKVQYEKSEMNDNSEVFELSPEDEKALEDFGAQLLWEYNYTVTD